MNAATFPLQVDDFVYLTWPWPDARPTSGRYERRAKVTCVIPSGQIPDMTIPEVAEAFEAFGSSSQLLQSWSVNRYVLKFDNGDIVIWDDFDHLRSFVKTDVEQV